jgi:hypothetical protein
MAMMAMPTKATSPFYSPPGFGRSIRRGTAAPAVDDGALGAMSLLKPKSIVSPPLVPKPVSGLPLGVQPHDQEIGAARTDRHDLAVVEAGVGHGCRRGGGGLDGGRFEK